MISERIVHLVKAEYAKPSEILALTFTEKASSEMQERVDIAMPYGYVDMWISTFHSFCDRLLRDEVLSIGLPSDYSLLTKPEVVQFIRNNLYEFNLEYFRPVGNPTKFIDGLATHFSRLQDEDITPPDYVKWAKTYKKNINLSKEEEKLEFQKYQELSRAYKKYEELKAKNGYFDFGDLIAKTLVLFRKRPNILSTYQEKFKYVLIDEFQDTNYAQFELSLMLSQKHKNITVVGDDDQSIYRFRGASVSNILQFKKKYKNAKTVVLTKNYRTNQEILDASYRLIKHNNPNRLEPKEGVNKKLLSQKKTNGEILFYHEKKIENEAERVVSKIIKLSNEEGYEWRDFAVLVRANAHADPFISALNYHSIPYQFLGPDKLFLQPEVIELVSYLKVLTDQNDSAALYQVLSTPELLFPALDLSKITSFARKKNRSLFEVIENIGQVNVSEESQLLTKRLLEIIHSQYHNLKNTSSVILLHGFLSEMNILEKYIDPDTEERQKRTLNISAFFEKLRGYESAHVNSTVSDVVDWIELASETGSSPLAAELDFRAENAVNILTIHSAKGLEFPVVFLVNLVNLRFPSVSRKDQIPVPDGILKEVLPSGDVHLQEERRLFYVGMTRAKDRLYFTAADFYGEAMSRPKKLSPFIFEALGDGAESAEEHMPKQLTLLNGSSKKSKKTKSIHPLHYLSYSQIESFKMCPLHYKLRYIFGIPTAPSGALSMGSSVHNTLKDYFENLKTGKKSSSKLLNNLLKEHWIDEGYISKSHENSSFQKASKMLKDFYTKEVSKIPLLLEQPFVVPLKKENEKPLRVGGTIDRVDQLSGNKIEIIDYKTGSKVPTQKEVDNNLQLSIYALAATRIEEPPFGKKEEDVVLSLWYLDENIKLTTTRTRKDLHKVENEIFEIRKEIEKSDFACSGHPFCNSCEYKNFCRQS